MARKNATSCTFSLPLDILTAFEDKVSLMKLDRNSVAEEIVTEWLARNDTDTMVATIDAKIEELVSKKNMVIALAEGRKAVAAMKVPDIDDYIDKNILQDYKSGRGIPGQKTVEIYVDRVKKAFGIEQKEAVKALKTRVVSSLTSDKEVKARDKFVEFLDTF